MHSISYVKKYFCRNLKLITLVYNALYKNVRKLFLGYLIFDAEFESATEIFSSDPIFEI